MGTIDKTSEYAHKAADKITDVTHQTMDKLGEKGEQLMRTVDKASEYAHKATDKVTDVTHQAMDKLGEKGEQLKNMEERMMNDFTDYTRKHPLKAVAIAAGVGFLLSKLFSKNR
ncbi:YqjD family protein [Nitrosomonas sp. Nm58]|jgi:ElaB/YqjD/DUF883 family membrane-anchored ribosome-binding protein|uniref:DUF883 family protein n=1 Tax=Nitrosomonas sp. Nm58 TaxID=200126 RepID=UPI00089AA0CE|nr:hypothetical protein [Nitrosomonas sp. Nm58]SDZ15402.1 Membrane-anchored ribosome-binding protein, inhibits growth in stationary phase, ElaB/YqjD/DUF883 family [Nitrosomonas sp. Nm58]